MEKQPRVNKCPICGKSKNTIYARETRTSSQGQSDMGLTGGDKDYYFFCNSCDCLFDVRIQYRVIDRKTLFNHTGNSGING